MKYLPVVFGQNSVWITKKTTKKCFLSVCGIWYKEICGSQFCQITFPKKMFLIKILLKEWKSIDWQEKKIGKRETATVTIFFARKSYHAN